MWDQTQLPPQPRPLGLRMPPPKGFTQFKTIVLIGHLEICNVNFHALQFTILVFTHKNSNVFQFFVYDVMLFGKLKFITSCHVAKCIVL
jgi:hypothetical protein